MRGSAAGSLSWVDFTARLVQFSGTILPLMTDAGPRVDERGSTMEHAA